MPTGARRGIAMMLVLVALLVTTILVGAALTSRDNSGAIGQNAITSTEAAWSAASGANFAVGAVAQASDLAALMGGDASLTQTMSVNGVDVEITITNLLGAPPTGADRELLVTARAEVNGIERTVVRQVTVLQPVDIGEAIDPYLDEFGVFADGYLQIQDGAVIRPWALSPEGDTGRAKIGIGFDALGMLDIGSAVSLSKAGLYTDIDASLALESAVAARGAGVSWAIPLDIPAIGAGGPNGFDALPDFGTDVDLDALSSSLGVPGHYGEIRVRNNATLLIDASNGAMYCCDRLRVEAGGVLRVRGEVRLMVEDGVAIDAGAIVLDDGASVTMYVGSDLTIENRSKVGIAASDLATPSGSVGAYVAPSRCRIVALAPGDGGTSYPMWEIESVSVVVGALHCPHGAVVINGTSTIFGRASARDFSLAGGCALFSCPTLDSRMGLTEPDGPLYNDDGTPIDGLVDVLGDVVSSAPATADDFVNLFESLWDDYIDLSGGAVADDDASGGITILDIALPLF